VNDAVATRRCISQQDCSESDKVRLTLPAKFLVALIWAFNLARFSCFEFGYWPKRAHRITKRVPKIEKVVKTEHRRSVGM
jgi:hypothetical protein